MNAMLSASAKLYYAITGTLWIPFTSMERNAVVQAIGQMTDGNARDFGEWKSQTHGTAAEWRALLRAEARLRSGGKP